MPCLRDVPPSQRGGMCCPVLSESEQWAQYEAYEVEEVFDGSW
ncbi:hypothetical protein V2W30_41420 (plasmid) [Streptomyces sp. Q6]|uniref:Uncharacterized protein n=1 Tax=Streptomyces citrinus TaxID=3118173 RepID=A0ACD5AQY4_9ACTN